MRINAQLIDARDGHHVWADRYDRELSDVFAVQDEVIRAIVAALSVELTDSEEAHVTRAPTQNLEAYDFFLRAKQGDYSGDVNRYRESMMFYTKAIELDPGFADAYSGLARLLAEVWRLDYVNVLPSAVSRKRAYHYASEALRLDSDNAVAYAVLSVVQAVDGRYDEALISARKAVALSPNDAEVHATYALVLSISGMHEQAVSAIETALRLDPEYSSGISIVAGQVLLIARKADRAVPFLQSARAELPNSELIHEYLAMALARLGRFEEARREIAAVLEIIPHQNLGFYRLAYSHLRRAEDLDFIVESLRMAGLPERPFGFVVTDSDALDGDELVRLVEAGTWTGFNWMGSDKDGLQFMKSFGAGGDVAYRNRVTFVTGTAKVIGDRLCVAYEAYLMGREQCGQVYRNPAGTRANANEYVYVNETAVKYFTAAR